MKNIGVMNEGLFGNTVLNDAIKDSAAFVNKALKAASEGMTFSSRIADALCAPTQSAVSEIFEKSEVNHRPAGWQQPVCTP